MGGFWSDHPIIFVAAIFLALGLIYAAAAGPSYSKPEQSRWRQTFGERPSGFEVEPRLLMLVLGFVVIGLIIVIAVVT